MKISEKQLTKIINESIRKRLNEAKRLQTESELKNKIKSLVREELESFGGMEQFEESDDDSESKGKSVEKKPLHNPDGVSDQNNETKEQQLLRSSIEKFFKSPSSVGRKVDLAGYAYQLDGLKPTPGEDSKEMKNSRSLFVKKLNHEPNDQGYPYSFSTDEINRLASMISSNNKVRESVRSSFKKMLKEAEEKKNVGYHVGGFGYGKKKSKEELAKEKETNDHKFDDKYWADKNKKGEDVLKEMIAKSVRESINKMLNGNK